MIRMTYRIKTFSLFFALLFFTVTPGYALDITLVWDANMESDIAGYKIYYDIDAGPPYDGMEAQEGFSPIDVMLGQDEDSDLDIVQYTTHGLPDGIYFFSVTAYNSKGLESGYSNEVSTGSYSKNQPPMADAGPDQSVNEGVIVSLNGLNSTDPDDGLASYNWQQTVGSPVVLLDPWAPETTFISPNVGPEGESLYFQLTITDNGGSSSSDVSIVNVIWVNEPPTAEAGPDQTAYSGDIVTLDASMSSDLDDGITSYYWEQTGGPSVSLSARNSMQATFVAPSVGDDGDSFSFLLTVTDKGGLKSKDISVVNVTGIFNSPPIADAGPDQEVSESDIVLLDGSNSFDPDDGIGTYSWKQKTGTPVTLNEPAAARTTFIAPKVQANQETLTFELTVTDKGGLKSTDDSNVNVDQNQYSTSLTDFWISYVTIELEGKGANYRAKTLVTVTEGTLNPLEGATVTVNWALNGRKLYEGSSKTNIEGIATLISKPAKIKAGNVFTVTITDVIKEGYTYDPLSNIRTTDSISVP